jgi:hypothetical protein
MKICYPKIPDVFWIKSFHCKCKKCGHEFKFLVPNGDDVVKFIELNGKEERWLPTYGVGGYLDVFCKLVAGHNLNDEITVKKANEFNQEIVKHSERSNNGNGFVVGGYDVICDQCNSKEITRMNESVLTSPPDIKWLKLSCKFTE